MSRAIRHELREHGPTLREIPTPTLHEYVQIVGAFYLDLKAEKERREQELYGGPSDDASAAG